MSKGFFGVLLSILFVHLDDGDKKGIDVIKRMKEYNIKEAAHVASWNENELSLRFFFCQSRWAPNACNNWDEKVHGMTCAK